MKTIYCGALQTCKLLGKIHTILPNTCLNTLYNVGSPVITSNPDVEYFGVGIPPVPKVEDGVLNLNSYPHSPLDGNVYKPLPIRFMLKTMDLTAVEQNDYRFRVELNVEGETYVAYYFKKLSTSKKYNYLNRIEIPNGTTELGFLSTELTSILNPLLDIDNRNHTYTPATRQVAFTQPLGVVFNASELEDMKLASELIYGTDNDSFEIGEVMIVSGIDSDVLGGGKELNGVQAMFFFELTVTSESTPCEYLFEVGSMDLVNITGL